MLHCDVFELDCGHSRLLRQEAWNSGSSLTSAFEYLTSTQIHTELDTIAVSIETSTLDVERKHNLEKRSEHRTGNMGVESI